MLTRGIDITPFELSHIAYRVPEWDQYLRVRTQLERHARANRENVWNGRPMSLIVFVRLEVLDGKALPMIELIPPVHQRVYTWVASISTSSWLMGSTRSSTSRLHLVRGLRT